MKVLGSVLQNLVLMTFARCGRTPAEGLQDESDIKARKRGVPLAERNSDGVSNHLYTYQELLPLFHAAPAWLDSMRDLMLAWSEKMVVLCKNSRHKARQK
jgi:hypothetical protein